MRIVDANRDDENARGRWFFTYNHDFDHPCFAPRPGFVRVKAKYQGMVGVLRHGGRKTQLTWLVNMDFGGLIPTAFTTGMLVSLMAFPISVAEDAKKLKDADKKKIATPSLTELDEETESETSGETLEQMKTNWQRAERRADALRDELHAVQGKFKVQSEEDTLKISTLTKEVSTLRQRLARVSTGACEGDENR